MQNNTHGLSKFTIISMCRILITFLLSNFINIEIIRKILDRRNQVKSALLYIFSIPKICPQIVNPFIGMVNNIGPIPIINTHKTAKKIRSMNIHPT